MLVLFIGFIIDAPLDLDELLWVLYQSSISVEKASANELASFELLPTTVAAKVDPLLLLDILDLFTSIAVFGGGGGGICDFTFPFSGPWGTPILCIFLPEFNAFGRSGSSGGLFSDAVLLLGDDSSAPPDESD